MINSTDVLRGNILIVDDQEANVFLLKEMLRSAGYSSITSTMNPARVCELHLRNRCDLILLDLQMSGMDGFQVMENLKQIETGGYLPVLVVTAQSDHKLRALKGGAKDFVSKPFDLAEVLIRVYNMLEVRLLHLETRRLYERVVAEQKVSERLLLDVLPRPLAEVLEGRPEGAAGLVAEGYAEMTVLFGDIAAFSRFAEGADAGVLAAVLEDIAAHFDRIAEHPDQERSRIVGDAYLAAVDLPDAVADPTIAAANLALDLLAALEHFNGHSRCKLKVGIGLDSGPALSLAGGRRKQPGSRSHHSE